MDLPSMILSVSSPAYPAPTARKRLKKDASTAIFFLSPVDMAALHSALCADSRDCLYGDPLCAFRLSGGQSLQKKLRRHFCIDFAERYFYISANVRKIFKIVKRIDKRLHGAAITDFPERNNGFSSYFLHLVGYHIYQGACKL